MKKKLLAVALSAVMVLGSSTMAFAAQGTTEATQAGATTVTWQGQYDQPVINVTVPTSVKFTLNPYRLGNKPQVYSAYEDASGVAVTEGAIISKSNVPLSFDVEIKVSGSAITFATKDITEKETAKAAFVYFEVKDGSAYKETYDKANSNQLLIASGAEGATKTKIGAISGAAGSVDNAGTWTVSPEAAQTGGKYPQVSFTLAGSANANPSEPWTANDKADLTVKFNFNPLSN